MITKNQTVISNLSYDFLIDTYNYGLLGKISAPIEEISYVGVRDLIRAYSSSQRYYHTVEHIVDCLRTYCVNEKNLLDPNIILAIWYHDSVYNPQSKTNEEDSVTYLNSHLHELNFSLSSERLDKVSEMILGSKSHTTYPSIFSDIDLAILGASPSTYDRYAANIRKEYGFVPEDIYKVERTKILRMFLNQPEIYTTDILPGYMEQEARVNLTREIEELSK